MKRRCTIWLTGLMLFTAICGCGAAKRERVSISGNVTYDGAPLDAGEVVFEPQGAGRMAIGQIAAGRYSIPAKYGPSAGEYIVRITAERPSGEKVEPSSYATDQTPQDVLEQFLPAKYNRSSELTISIDATSDVTHDFSLVSI